MQTKTKGIIYGIIYIAIFLSGKSYIGQTINLLRRENDSTKAMHGAVRRFRFTPAFASTGRKISSWKIIARADNIAALNAAEISAIAEHNTIAPNGYNANTGGENYIPCGETRAKDIIRREKRRTEIGGLRGGENVGGGEKANYAKSRVHRKMAAANARQVNGDKQKSGDESPRSAREMESATTKAQNARYGKRTAIVG